MARTPRELIASAVAGADRMGTDIADAFDLFPECADEFRQVGEEYLAACDEGRTPRDPEAPTGAGTFIVYWSDRTSEFAAYAGSIDTYMTAAEATATRDARNAGMKSEYRKWVAAAAVTL